ncbi:hypothetical protein BDW62DRAFT_4010 [Aspergillus aurantiobrunneus]
MRLPYAPSRALRDLRVPFAVFRSDARRFLHGQSQAFDAAVIGGGITGLTAAYRLSKNPLCSKITLYEKAPHLGGWLQSERIPVDGGDIVFEYGPRTMRLQPLSSLPLLDLLSDLQLEDQILVTPKSSPASQNRYIYYPDHLVRLPAPQKGANPISQLANLLRTLFREPLFETALWSIVTEPLKDPPQIQHQDESVTEFVSRRFSPEVANNLVSSIYHGILAGDIDRLSADALFGWFRGFEREERNVLIPLVERTKEGGRLLNADDIIAQHTIREKKSSTHINDLDQVTKLGSTLTLKNGVGQLADALVAELNRSDKVEVLTNANVTSISQDSMNSYLTVECGSDGARLHDRLIATNPAPDLARQLDHKGLSKNAKHPISTISALQAHNYAVTTMVINLYYQDPHLLPVRGFGYLIPRSIPYAQNPERALGVVFASESSIGQDSAPGTKLTVMLGGHYWDGWEESDYPDHDTAVMMAQSLLKRHLGITDSPTVARARLQREAIPQPTVGHTERMNHLSRSIQHEFDRRITLAGAWYAMGNTGVVDSIRQAYLAEAYGVRPLDPEERLPLSPLRRQGFDPEGGIITVPNRLYCPRYF